jgi:hypothetical protein
MTRLRQWMVTCVASLVTGYGLDVVATCTGLLLAGTGWLSGIDYRTGIALLLLTYVGWFFGAWSILRANWELLQRTGTSTNLFSKAGHDIAARLGWSVGWRRAATHTGYIITDLLKEVPYYVGAAGAAIFSESIAAVDAIIFLVGANIGATSYGFMQSYGMRRLVRHISRPR